MFQKEWEVLVVDDDPDVLEISRLALKSVNIYGAPLKLHLCGSKAEAVELIATKAQLLPALAVALIDVVMETDTAGLDLCRYIREECNNPLTQLFIRTGQPGLAPEREVIDRYDINGYFNKAEATQDKLYTMIKSGVRQHYWSSFALGTLMIVSQVNSAMGSRQKVASVLQKSFEAAFQERSGQAVSSYSNVNCAVLVGDDFVANVGWDQREALAVRDRLAAMEGVPLGPDGSQYVIDENNQLLIKVPQPGGQGDACTLATPLFRVPEFVPANLASALTCYAAAWRQSV
ncbi:response regulator receiver protein [bacterium]|nr:response regulator receiver protein [bacterium]